MRRDEPEDLHALRVAVRHARAVLWALGPSLPRQERDRWKHDLRMLAHATSDVRDWDVFLAETIAPARELEPDDTVLSAIADTARDRARHVLTVDIVPGLVELARTNLANAGVTNVDVAEGNAADGWSAAAPYDVICISGSLPAIPQSILSQIKVGGRIAAFIGELPVMEARLVTRVSETEYQVVNLFETAVKPLQGAARPSQFQF